MFMTFNRVDFGIPIMSPTILFLSNFGFDSKNYVLVVKTIVFLCISIISTVMAIEDGSSAGNYCEVNLECSWLAFK